MATKNLVPRADNEGNIGLSTKKWAGAHFTNGTFDEIKVRSLKASDDTNIIIADSSSNISVTTNTAGQYIIGGGSGSSAEADKIVKNDTSVTAIDNDGNDSKIELKVDDTLYWTFENDGDFIPTNINNPDIGSSTNKVQKLFVNSGNDSGIEIGDSLIKFDTATSKLQLQHKQSDPNATQLSNIITSAELTTTLSGYLQAEADTLDSVIARNASTTRAASINGVILGQISKNVKLQSIGTTEEGTDIDISIQSDSKALNISYGSSGNQFTELKKGKISIKSDSANESYIDLYNTTNTYYSRLKGATSTANRTHTLPDSSGVLALKSEVDAMASGVKVQKTVKAATTDSFTMASTASASTLVLADGEGGFNAGNNTYTVDGISLSQGSRVLIKDGVNSSGTGVLNKWNGIYTVGDLTAAALTLTRADDFNNGDSVSGFFTFVEQGTSNGDQGFVCTNNSGSDNPDGNTPIEFSQFTAAGQITGGDGLTKVGDALNVNADQSGTITSVGNLTSLTVDGISTLKGNVTLENKKGIIFKELTANGSEGITLSAPDSLDSSYSLQLPTVLPSTSGYVLSSSNQGVLSWIDSTSGNGIQSVQEDSNPQLGGSLKTGNYFIDGDLVPKTNNSKDLGKEAGGGRYNWRNLYLSGQIFLAPDYQIGHDNGYITLKKDTDESSSSSRFKLESSASSLTPNELILNFKNNQSAARTINKIDFDHNDITRSSIELDSTSNAVGYKFKLKTYGKNDDGNNDLKDRILIDTSNTNRDLHKIELSLPLEVKASQTQSSSIKLFEKSLFGSDYVEIKAPDEMKAGSFYTITLPSADGSTDQILKRNSNGDLEWSDQSSFNLNTDGGSQKTSLVPNDKFLIADSENNLANKKVNFSVIKDNIFSGYKENQPVELDYDPANDIITSTISTNSVSLDKISTIGSMKVLGNLGAAEANVTQVNVSNDLNADNPDDSTLVTQKAIREFVLSNVGGGSSTQNSVLEITSLVTTPEFYYDEANSQVVGATLKSLDQLEGSSFPSSYRFIGFDATKRQVANSVNKFYQINNNVDGFNYNNVELSQTDFDNSVNGPLKIKVRDFSTLNYKIPVFHTPTNTDTQVINETGTQLNRRNSSASNALPLQQLINCNNFKFFWRHNKNFGRYVNTKIKEEYLKTKYTNLFHDGTGGLKSFELTESEFRSYFDTSEGVVVHNDDNNDLKLKINGSEIVPPFPLINPININGTDSLHYFYGGERFNLASYHINYNVFSTFTGSTINRTAISSLMNRYSDDDIDTQFRGIPTVFMPELNQDVIFNDNTYLGRIIKLQISNPHDERIIVCIKPSKNNDNGHLLLPKTSNDPNNNSNTYQDSNTIVPTSYVSDLLPFKLNDDYIGKRLKTGQNENWDTFGRNPRPSNLNVYDGVLISSERNSIEQYRQDLTGINVNRKIHKICEWNNYILLPIKAKSAVELTFKIGNYVNPDKFPHKYLIWNLQDYTNNLSSSIF